MEPAHTAAVSKDATTAVELANATCAAVEADVKYVMEVELAPSAVTMRIHLLSVVFATAPNFAGDVMEKEIAWNAMEPVDVSAQAAEFVHTVVELATAYR